MKLVPLSALVLIAPLAAQDAVVDAGRHQGTGLEEVKKDGPPPPWRIAPRDDRFSLEDAGRHAGIGLGDATKQGPPPPWRVKRPTERPDRWTLSDGGRAAGIGVDKKGSGPSGGSLQDAGRHLRRIRNRCRKYSCHPHNGRSGTVALRLCP